MALPPSRMQEDCPSISRDTFPRFQGSRRATEAGTRRRDKVPYTDTGDVDLPEWTPR